jgi:hypothetical protein
MRNAEEFPGQPSDRTRRLPTYRRLGARPGRGRYARDETVPRETVPPAEPHCTVNQGAPGHQGGFSYQGAPGYRGGAEAGRDGGELGIAWSAQFPVAGRRNDLWVLVCGGIATAAAFAAAFVASGGVASHAATTGTAVPAAVSRACPSPVPGPTP